MPQRQLAVAERREVLRKRRGPGEPQGMNRKPYDISFFARTNFRNERRLFGIRQPDRLAHMYLIGKTGTGKSTLMETLLRQDVRAGRGFVLLDPHGDLVQRVRAFAEKERPADVIWFDAPDRSRPVAFNPLERVPPTKRPVAASGLLEVFRKLWPDFWGPRLEHVLRNGLLALLDQPEATLADIPRLFDDKEYRKAVALRVANPEVRRFWLREFEGYPARLRAEAIAPIQNKVGAFLADPVLRGILAQPRSAFDLRDVMDRGKILLVNLAKGLMGEDSAALLGSLLVTSIGVAALGRADQPEAGRRPLFLYLDEFQTLTTLALATMLSELRKYGVGLVLAHQYLGQLDPKVRDAILGNVGTIVCFRVGAQDAEILEREFRAEFSALDLVRLPNHSAYVRLMVDGVAAAAFSGETLTFADGVRRTP